MPYIQTSRLKVEYERAGNGSHVIVLVHGNFASWRWWKPFMDRLPKGFLAYAPVTRGCGDTSGYHGSFTIKRLAADLRSFVKALKLKRFHLVGHSLGGAIATQFALDFPRSVKTLTLVAPAPPDGLKSMRKKKKRRNGQASMAVDRNNSNALSFYGQMYNVARFWGVNRVFFDGALRNMMPAMPANYRGFGQLVSDAARLGPNTIAGFYKALDKWNQQKRVAEIRVPTRILWGKLDTIIPKNALKKFNRALPKSKMIVWRDTGHTPQIEKPARFVNFVIGFIGTTSPSSFLYWMLHLFESNKRRFLTKIKRLSPYRRLGNHR